MAQEEGGREGGRGERHIKKTLTSVSEADKNRHCCKQPLVIGILFCMEFMK